MKKILLCGLAVLLFGIPVCAQNSGFAGDWNWWLNKTEGRGFTITLKVQNGWVSGSGEGFINKTAAAEIHRARINRNTAIIRVTSDWGGEETVRITLRGTKLDWKVIRKKGDLFFPGSNIVLMKKE